METPSALRYQGHVDAADFVAARRLSLKPRRLMRVIFGVAGIVLTINCAWLLYFGWIRGRWHPLLMPILGTAAFLGFYLFVLLPWNARRAFRSEPTGGEVSATGVSSDALGTVAWPQCRHWKRNARIALIYYSDDDYVLIPWRAFGDRAATATASELIEKHLGPPA